jgi:hypothetical protein
MQEEVGIYELARAVRGRNYKNQERSYNPKGTNLLS